MRILVTGGAGFIGSSFVRYVLQTQKSVEVVNFDLLTYAGNLRNLDDVASNPRYSFVRGDIANPAQVTAVFDERRFDAVVNFAAETHVDRSIEDPAPFLRTNVAGTQCLLEHARRFKVSKFIQISTDEVYGSLGPAGFFREDTPWEWRSEIDFSEGLARTIDWYRTHPDWIREIKDASYLAYYDRMYTRRDEILAGLGS